MKWEGSLVAKGFICFIYLFYLFIFFFFLSWGVIWYRDGRRIIKRVISTRVFTSRFA